MEIISLSTSKNTDTVQRFKIHYCDPKSDNNKDLFLRVETSFRGLPDLASIEIVNNIRTYRINEMYAQKLEAINTRTKGRDLFDLAYLTHEYGDQISDAELARAEILGTYMPKYTKILQEINYIFISVVYLSLLNFKAERRIG